MSKNDELSTLQAELEAARAEIAALKAKSEKKSTRAAVGMPEDQMAPADTTLGRVQRLDRAAQIDAFPKLARLLPVSRVCELIVAIAGEAAGSNGSVDEVVTTVTTRAPKKAKGEKVVEDNTAVEPQA